MWEGNTQGKGYHEEVRIGGAILEATYNLHIITSEMFINAD